MKLANDRLISFENACHLREKWHGEGLRVALTNGCFDLLHPGHLHLLQQAATLADRLIVALNSDGSVQSLKGPSRPVLNQGLRAYSLASLRAVDAIFIFDGSRVTEEILALAPDIYVRAADKTVANLHSKELQALRSVGAEIHFVDFLPNFSTTTLLEHIRQLFAPTLFNSTTLEKPSTPNTL